MAEDQEEGLRSAAEGGRLDDVQRLVEQEQADTNATDEVLWTALHLACRYQHLEIVRYLIQSAHANVEARTVDGLTPLHLACTLSITTFLVETAGADVNAKTNEGDTPLHYVSIDRSEGVVRYLVEQTDANVNIKNNDDETPLRNAFRHHHEGAIRCLLPRTTSIDEALLGAPWEECCSWEIKEMTLERFATVHLGYPPGSFHTNLLHGVFKMPLPSRAAFEDCIWNCYLTDTLCRVDAQGRLPIHVALTSENLNVKSPSIVSLLVEHGPRATLARDPTTGLYPHETAASLVISPNDDDNGAELDEEQSTPGWLDIVYESFRCNPMQLLNARGLP